MSHPRSVPAGRSPLALLVVLFLAVLPAAAGATPITLGKDDVVGGKRAAASTAKLRAELVRTMRGGPRGAVRSAPAAASGFVVGATRVLTGSVELRSDPAAKATLKAAGQRTSIGKRSSTATATVRAGRIVGFVLVQGGARDKTVRAAADAYAALLSARLAAQPATVAERLADDADASKAEALALFQLAYGGMPGAKIPAGPRGTVDDGTIALSRLWRLRSSLSPAQQAALSRATDDPADASAGRAPAPRALRLRRSADPRAKRLALPADATAQTMADIFTLAYLDGSRVGPGGGVPKAKTFNASKSGLGATADSFPVNAKGKGPAFGADFDHCRIRLGKKYYASSPASQAFSLAHEVFHCVTFRITDDWGGNARDWIIEGMANWAASQISTGGIDNLGYEHYVKFLGNPQRPLFTIAYTAVGFWGHQNERLGNLWPRVIPILRAGDNEASFDAAGGTVDDALATSASGFLRTPGAPPAWVQTQPWAVAEATVKTPRAVSASASSPLNIAAHANQLTQVLPVAKRPVVEVRRSKGHIRATDGTADYPDSALTYFCLPSGRCECPPDETAEGLPSTTGVDQLTVALTGDKSGGAGAIVRHSMSEYCKKDKQPRPLGGGGPGGSNGDPHLTSLDGLRYDFQAAGEFVLARSGSDLEVQARQEPWKIGKLVVRSVTINTQLAVRVGAVRATFSPGTTPQMRIAGGAPQSLASGAQIAIGAGRATSDGEQITVTWPDGSTAVVWSVGEWGVAFSLELADARKGTATGLLGNFDSAPADDLRTRAGKVVAYTAEAAPWPGVSRVSIADPTDPAFADRLYDVVGDSWRISQKESLMDYAKGESTKTFTDQSIPRKLVEADDLSDDKRAAAEATCRGAGVTAPAALEDCILDVGVTGQAAFATAAAKEEALLSIGWTRLAAGGARNGPASLARTGDGTLHLVWQDRDAAGKRSVVAAALPAAGGERGPVTVAPFDTTPYVFTAPDGGLRMVGSVIDLGPPITEGTVQFGSSAPFDTWSALPMIASPGSYVGEPQGLFVGDTLLTVSGLAGGGKVFRGTGNPNGGGEPLNGALSGDCYAMKPAIATTGAETYAAFWQWDCPQAGLFVAPIDPATGKPGDEIAVPQSTWGTPGASAGVWDAPGLDRLSLAARPGGGVFLAYARDDGDSWSVLLWRIGSPTPTTVASGLQQRPDGLQVSAEPTTGHLWVGYESQDAAFGKGRFTVRRTNQAADGWAGSPRVVAFPSDGDPRAAPNHPWDMLARDGALDLVAGYPATGDFPGGLWRGVIGG